jgi:hypothetical protein
MGRWTERLKEKRKMQGQPETIVASVNLPLDEKEELIGIDPNPKELSSIHKTKEHYEPIQEAPKSNIRNVEVKIEYSKGNLRIEVPDNANLFHEIKRDFPKGSIVFYDGDVYVAFYYLPVVIKTLEKRFGNIDIDSSIPDVEIVRRFLPMRQVYLEKDLAAELNNPITQALLKRKSQQEIAEITSQLKAELRRSKWVDTIWEAVEKAAAQSEVINGVGT